MPAPETARERAAQIACAFAIVPVTRGYVSYGRYCAIHGGTFNRGGGLYSTGEVAREGSNNKSRLLSVCRSCRRLAGER